MRAPRDVGQRMDDRQHLVELRDFADVDIGPSKGTTAPPHLRLALIEINERHLVQRSDGLAAALWREPLSARLIRAIGPDCHAVLLLPIAGSFAWRIDGKRALNDEDLA